MNAPFWIAAGVVFMVALIIVAVLRGLAIRGLDILNAVIDFVQSDKASQTGCEIHCDPDFKDKRSLLDRIRGAGL